MSMQPIEATEIEQPYADERPAPAPLAMRREDAPMQPAARAPLAPRAEPPPERRAGPSMSASTDDFFGAFVDMKLDFPAITKGRRARIVKGGAAFEYKYANLADAMEKIEPVMSKHRFAYSTMPMGNRVYVRLVHGPSRQWIEGVLPLALPDHGSDVQRMGSALTYTERYILLRLLGVTAFEDDDDDGAAAMPPARGRA